MKFPPNEKNLKIYRYFTLTVLLLSLITGLGWFAADYLGDKAKQDIIRNNENTISFLSMFFNDTKKEIQASVTAIAGSAWIAPALISHRAQDIEKANAVLDRYNGAFAFSVSYLIDRHGITIASSNRHAPDSFIGQSYQFRPYFTQAMQGHQALYFALGVTSGKRGCYASHTVKDGEGKIIGVVVIKKDIDQLEDYLGKYPYGFVVDQNGIIFLSSNKEMLFKSLWPLRKEAEESLRESKQFGARHFPSLMPRAVANGTEVKFNGHNCYVSRRLIEPAGWSLVLLTPTRQVLIHQLMGGVTTISLCVLVIIIFIISYTTAGSIEHKKSEAAVRESESQLRQIIDSLPQMIFVKDWNGIFLIANQALAKAYSTTVKELTGKSQTLVHKEESELAQMLRDDRQVMTTGKTKFIPEETFIDAEGTQHFLQTTKMPFSMTNGQSQAVLGIAIDITERKHLQAEQVKMAERLHRLEKMEALGTLAGGVAHDLNNVLGVSMGYAELLREKVPQGSPLRSYAENILTSNQKGAAIIQDLLTLARRGVSTAKIIDINSFVDTVLKSPEFEKLRDYHPAVAFKTDLGRDLLHIKGSPVHLEKAVLNLISNAAEAIIGSGEVNIRTENRYLDKALRGYDTVKEGDYVVLTVSDTGSGIPAADLDKIFEPFFTKKAMGRSGTGLGLAIVWGTVKDHEGYIDVQSREGKGSTFSLYFAATRDAVHDEPQEIPCERYRGHGESVLVVDDVEGQRTVAASMLERLGYRVHAVASGEAAVEYLKNNKADILVLDMIMPPGIDGLETYQRILKINPKQKAIIVSGFSETDRVRETQKLGAGGYVKKPYLMEKIGIAVRDELARG